MDKNTIRVLSLDGGGVRGVVTSTLLSLFCNLAGIPGDQIYKYFDIIAGTSIGGIQALAYAKGLTPSYMQNMLITNASTIFNCTYPIPGGGQAGYGTWAGYLSGIYGSLYSQPPLADIINSNFGTDTIDTYQTNVLVPAFQRSDSTGVTNVPVYFSNIPSSVVPYLSGRTELAANIALATSAAPVYLPPAVFNGCTYVDGGTFLNNPSAFALAAQRALKPTVNRFCVLSIGTGLGSIGYIPGETLARATSLDGAIDNLKTIKMVMDISMNIPPQGVSVEQQILNNYTVGNYYYCRLQYPLDLTQAGGSTLDDSSPTFLQYMQTSAATYFNNNIETVTNFIGHFTA